MGRRPPGCWWTHSELPGGVQATLIHPPLTPRRSTSPWDTPFSDSSFLFPSSPLPTEQRQATARQALTTYLPLLPKRGSKIPPSWLEKCPVLGQRLPWPNHCSSGYTLYPLWHPGIQSLQTAFQGPTLFLKSLFYCRIITLQHCDGFCHTSISISHMCTCVPPPWAPSHFPPYPIPLGYPRAPALSALLHASNLDWSSILHMVIYLFQCYSLKSCHLSFSHRIQKSVLYICVSFAFLHIGVLLLSF